jgi:hypothetical protein
MIVKHCDSFSSRESVLLKLLSIPVPGVLFHASQSIVKHFPPFEFVRATKIICDRTLNM